MLQRHTVAREKLKIAYEQEILRTHANAKRLEENQPKPYSACMVLQAEFENQYELIHYDIFFQGKRILIFMKITP